MKRLTCILLAFCMAISTCCVSASAALFTDVPDSFWASEEIAWAVDEGIVNGTSTTTFSPGNKTLRGQMTAILYRYAGEPAVSGASSFSDVKPTVYYANAANWAQKNHILVSTVSGQFLGDTPISRAEFCAMVYNYAGFKGFDRKTASDAPFSDVKGLSSELRTAVNWAYANGIVNGVGGNRFAPNDTLTRAQAVVMLYRFENIDFDDPSSGGEVQPPANTDYISGVIALVNQERAKEGLDALETNGAIAEAAQIRADELLTLFSHTRPDGRSCFTVLAEVGISYRAAGENIAMGYFTPESVVEGWMNSPGHRANILNGGFTTIGVGYNSSKRCWVQLFTA